MYGNGEASLRSHIPTHPTCTQSLFADGLSPLAENTQHPRLSRQKLLARELKTDIHACIAAYSLFPYVQRLQRNATRFCLRSTAAKVFLMTVIIKMES